jgi:hypothetical protein
VIPGPPDILYVRPGAIEPGHTRRIRVEGKNLIDCEIELDGPVSLLETESSSSVLLFLDVLAGASSGPVDIFADCASGTTLEPEAFYVLSAPTKTPPPEEGGSILIVSPKNFAQFDSAGGPVTVTVQVQVSEFVPGVDGKIRYYVGGNQVAESNTAGPVTLANVPIGRQHITATLTHPDGRLRTGKATSHTVWVVVRRACASDAQCADNNPCSVHKCTNGVCAYGPTPLGGQTCCISSFDCPYGWDCESGLCRQCALDAHCVEGIACTIDECGIQGSCIRDYEDGCCAQNLDCKDDRDCTIDSCSNGQCVYQQLADCCDTNAECDDGEPCTKDACVSNTCQNLPIKNCCTEAADCDDDDECTTDLCDTDAGKCEFIELPTQECCRPGDPNCCNADNECNDRNHCTIDICDLDNHTCTHVRVPMDEDSTCCVSDIDCADGVPCNVDRCVRGDCRYGPDPQYGTPWVAYYNTCCVADPSSLPHYTPYLGCDDHNDCTVDWCDGPTFTCQHEVLQDPNCCTTALDCEDGDPSTLDACIQSQCTFIADPSYCSSDDDCEDGQPCTIGECKKNLCVQTLDKNCCTSNRQCRDGNPCTVDRCDSETRTCESESSGACCTTNAECGDDDACTLDICANGKCRSYDVPNCCSSDADCSSPSACVATFCSQNTCVTEPLAGSDCCTTHAECNDGKPCTVDSCVPSVGCVHAPLQGCCTQASQCSDADICTADACIDNTCVNQPLTQCCVTHADCDDGLVCSIDQCLSQKCVYGPNPECTSPLPMVVEFQPGTDGTWLPPQWVFEQDGGPLEVLVESGDLRISGPNSGNGGSGVWLASPETNTSDLTALTVQARVDSFVATKSNDLRAFGHVGGEEWIELPRLDAPSAAQPLWTWDGAALVGFPRVRVAWKITPSTGQTTVIDRLWVAAGAAPRWVKPSNGFVNITQTNVSLPKAETVEAFDPDGDAVTFVLEGAPSWVVLDNYTLATLGFATKVILLPTPASAVEPTLFLLALDGDLASMIPVKVKLK